jgi:endonuclease-3
MDIKEKVSPILKALDQAYPNAKLALHFSNAFELLVATILSAQCTDERVNQVTPSLFKRYPDARALAQADQAELEDDIRSTGFFRNKAKSLKGCAQALVEKHGGKVPPDLDALVQLPGIGRKTANVVLGAAYGIPGIVVDTHVSRITQRLGLTKNTDPVKIEFDLMEILPQERWTLFSHQIILHGRQICVARKPLCDRCPLSAWSDYYQNLASEKKGDH